MDDERCPLCDLKHSHRHCDRCVAEVSCPPFHCATCSRILCDHCVQEKGCCGHKPAREG
jgi:hypothetical protein